MAAVRHQGCSGDGRGAGRGDACCSGCARNAGAQACLVEQLALEPPQIGLASLLLALPHMEDIGYGSVIRDIGALCHDDGQCMSTE